MQNYAMFMDNNISKRQLFSSWPIDSMESQLKSSRLVILGGRNWQVDPKFYMKCREPRTAKNKVRVFTLLYITHILIYMVIYHL